MMIRLGRLQGKEEDTELLLVDLHLTQSCAQSCPVLYPVLHLILHLILHSVFFKVFLVA